MLLFASAIPASGSLLNGNFAVNGGSGQLTVNTTLANWTGIGKEGLFGSQTTPPVFVFSTGTTTELQTTGANGDAFMGNVQFWAATAAPGGGVIVAADGDSTYGGGIQQTVTGLVVGDSYSLAFNWEGAQQRGFSGVTTESWQVNFGASQQSTPVLTSPNNGATGWQSANMTFTATSTSQLLRFLAVGSPNGQPPWLLLNNVTLTDVTTTGSPEPGTLVLVLLMVPVGFYGRRKLKKSVQ